MLQTDFNLQSGSPEGLNIQHFRVEFTSFHVEFHGCFQETVILWSWTQENDYEIGCCATASVLGNKWKQVSMIIQKIYHKQTIDWCSRTVVVVVSDLWCRVGTFRFVTALFPSRCAGTPGRRVQRATMRRNWAAKHKGCNLGGHRYQMKIIADIRETLFLKMVYSIL